MKYYSQSVLNSDKEWLEGLGIWLGLFVFYGLPPIWIPFEEYWQAFLVWMCFGSILVACGCIVCRTLIAIYRVYIKKGVKEK